MVSSSVAEGVKITRSGRGPGDEAPDAPIPGGARILVLVTASEPISDFSSEAITREIRVQVVPQLDPGRSRPEAGRWFFLYTVTIENLGERTVRLVSRHWVITDGAGRVEEVRGPGVVGEQPVLEPGQSFRYTSGCPLPTDVGKMEGSYQMEDTATGDAFDIEIAPFTLCAPGLVH